MRIVPVTQMAARAFVDRHHRHCRPPRGDVIRCGVVDEKGELRGVAMAGRPVARLLDDGVTLEVTRVATDGAQNACSALYGAIRRAAKALGYTRLVTYTLQSEGGASLRGAGWKVIAERKPRKEDGWQNRPGRKWQTVVGQAKLLWEAGP